MVAINVFQWAVLDKYHRQKAVPPEDVDAMLEAGWEIPDGRPHMVDYHHHLPHYSTVKADNDLVTDYLDPHKKWAVVNYHVSSRKHKRKQDAIVDMPMWRISGGGVSMTDWTELLPGLCLHGLKVANMRNRGPEIVVEEENLYV